jgi:hypothetical protein
MHQNASKSIDISYDIYGVSHRLSKATCTPLGFYVERHTVIFYNLRVKLVVEEIY